MRASAPAATMTTQANTTIDGHKLGMGCCCIGFVRLVPENEFGISEQESKAQTAATTTKPTAEMKFQRRSWVIANDIVTAQRHNLNSLVNLNVSAAG